MIALLKAGQSQSNMAHAFYITSSTILLAKERWDQHHNLASRARQGRPQKLSPMQIKTINLHINRNRHDQWKEVKHAAWLNISTITLRRYIHLDWQRKWRS